MLMRRPSRRARMRVETISRKDDHGSHTAPPMTKRLELRRQIDETERAARNLRAFGTTARTELRARQCGRRGPFRDRTLAAVNAALSEKTGFFRDAHGASRSLAQPDPAWACVPLLGGDRSGGSGRAFGGRWRG